MHGNTYSARWFELFAATAPAEQTEREAAFVDALKFSGGPDRARTPFAPFADPVSMPLQTAPVVRAQMLIRRPVSEVYRAFVDPTVTTRFWFTRGSGPLEPGAEVRWDWEMYGVHTLVRVRELEPDRRILVEWDDPPCPVEWTFTPREDGSTLVVVSSWGFGGSEDEVVAKAIDSMGGFSLLLAGAKAWLELGIALNLVGDHHPDAHVGTDG